VAPANLLQKVITSFISLQRSSGLHRQSTVHLSGRRDGLLLAAAGQHVHNVPRSCRGHSSVPRFPVPQVGRFFAAVRLASRRLHAGDGRLQRQEAEVACRQVKKSGELS